LVTLMEEHEFGLLAVNDFAEKVRIYIPSWYHLPIPDVCAPGVIFTNLWESAGPKLREILHEGGKILIHCRGGLGRTGTVAAQLLVELGMKPEETINKVRKARPGAIESREQENYVYRCTSIKTRLNYQHFLGCLLGGAVGDALGAPVEFSTTQEIKKKYGKDGICNYDPTYGRKGAITDDTQMTLFTAEGLLRAHCRGMHKGIRPAYESVVYQAYLRWLYTQGEKVQPQVDDTYNGWLLTVPELYSRRAPGNSCLSALKSGRMGTIEAPINNSKGCGGVMRAAPVGLYGAVASKYLFSSGQEITSIFDLGCKIAAITHGHPSGYLPAGCLASIISSIISGYTLKDAIQKTIAILKKVKGHEETLETINIAMDLWKDKTIEPCPSTIEKIGGGWVGEEALAISLYCALSYDRDFLRGLCLAVNHSGDSDSTGAITGNILGALHGTNAIPDIWLNELEMKNVIEEVACDLLTLFKDTDDWYKKYPGC